MTVSYFLCHTTFLASGLGINIVGMESASQFTWHSLVYSLIRNNDNFFLYSQTHSIQSIRKRGEGDQKDFYMSPDKDSHYLLHKI